MVLNDLLPNKDYFLRVALSIKENDLLVMSDIISARTKDVENNVGSGIEIRKIDVKLSVNQIKPESAVISWRFFSFDEKKYIDGVQIRFHTLSEGSLTSGVPGTTPFIHRDTNFYLLNDLKPDTEYQLDLYLIPVPKSLIELTSVTVVKFKTPAPEKGKFLGLLVCR